MFKVFHICIMPAIRLSHTFGEATEAYETASTGRRTGASIRHTRGHAEEPTRRVLLTPDEVMRLLTVSAAPILAAKPGYYADPKFHGLFADSVDRTSGAVSALRFQPEPLPSCDDRRPDHSRCLRHGAH